MADEDDVAQVFVLQHVADVVDVHVEADVSSGEMTPFAETGQRWSEHKVPMLAQKRHDFLPEPCSVPGRVYQNEDFRIHALRPTGHVHHGDQTCPPPGGPERVSTGRLRMRGHGRDNAVAGRLVS